MDEEGLALGELVAEPAGGASTPAAVRVHAMVREHHAFVWRSVRRLGVREAEVDDVAQQVFVIAARRLGDIPPGGERAFLFGAAMRAAANARRSEARRREADPGAEGADEPPDPAPGPEELVAARRRRALLDTILEALPLDLRAVLVLFEVEEMSTSEIALLLGIPTGTVASRLRRAREAFQSELRRVEARASVERGPR